MQAQDHGLHTSLQSSIDKSPYVNFMEDGMVAAITNDGDKSPYVNFMEDGMVAAITNDGHDNDNSLHSQIVGGTELNDGMAAIQQSENTGEIQNNEHDSVENRNSSEGNVVPDTDQGGSQEQELYTNKIRNAMAPVKRSLNQLARSQGWSIWLLFYIAIVMSWPSLRNLGFFLFGKRFRNFLTAKKL
jgi:hypothetical protein